MGLRVCWPSLAQSSAFNLPLLLPAAALILRCGVLSYARPSGDPSRDSPRLCAVLLA